jgi:REP element-mobilizing transposase RayT
MPRPLRIEYENAFYHVMNRGRSKNNIFFNDIHYLTFINTVRESCKRFGSIIHSYCLMPNHYHLLIQTPNANLSRLMGHINSVYTKRFNKIQKMDGPLFRGRYKAILVDEDDYLLELSRYIHRNPIETKNEHRRLVKDLKDYKWSSYPSYLNISYTPKWLDKETTISMFKKDEDQIKRYQSFVEKGKNKELEEFFSKKNQATILGKREFIEKVLISDLEINKKNRIKKETNQSIDVKSIIENVAKTFKVSIQSITTRQTGRQKSNTPRAITMYLIQEYKDYKLIDIAKIFDLNNTGSVAKSIFKAKLLIKKEYSKEFETISKSLWLMEKA